MRLNLPILDQLQSSQNILIAGAGGGFDVFAGLPIYFTLREQGKTVHLANFSFADLELTSYMSKTEKIIPNLLIGAQGEVEVPLTYCPEPYLAQWFRDVHGEAITIWMFANTGALPLIDAYKTLVEHLAIDAIVLVDGGVDSIMRGDESGAGTIVEDTLSLIAVEPLDVPVKILACIGFGTEVEEAVCHYSALENMAALFKADAFYGSCALVKQMPAFQQFEAACRYVWEQPKHTASHISTRIIPAVHGEFGNYQMYPQHRNLVPILVSPLMAQYWFFDANKVIERNLLRHRLCTTHNKQEAMHLAAHFIASTPSRARRSLPY
ncbi:MAG: DUF1152 domain-containing protein [Chloroflexi bacterium]|nr:DUF1152 domain-containing protein [Chloroflexota bacterium]